MAEPKRTNERTDNADAEEVKSTTLKHEPSLATENMDKEDPNRLQERKLILDPKFVKSNKLIAELNRP
jgi:hypothetical protein